MGSTAPPPSQSHQQHQHGITLAFDRETNRIGTAKSQQRCCRSHPGPCAHLAKGNGLTDHHQTASHIRQPRQQAKGHRALANQMPPDPKQAVVGRGMGVFPQHRQQAAETGLKTLANAVQLIAPERCGVDQQQGPQSEGQTKNHHQHKPAALHRLLSCAALRCLRNSSPMAGPGCQPAAIKSCAVCGA